MTLEAILDALWAGGRLECLNSCGKIVPIYPECGWDAFYITKQRALKLFKLGYVEAEYDADGNSYGQYAITDKGLAELDRLFSLRKAARNG